MNLRFHPYLKFYSCLEYSQICHDCLFAGYFQIKLVNINSSDLVDGRPPVVLGLIWTIILYFQVTLFSPTENTPLIYCFEVTH